MGIIFSIFYGLVGVVGLFFAFTFEVSMGINNSKQVKALRTNLKK